MIRDRRQIIRRYIYVSAMLLIAWAGIIRACVMPRLPRQIRVIDQGYQMLLVVGISVLVLYIAVIFLENKAYKGVKYSYIHYNLMNKIRRALKDAGYYVERNFRAEKVAVLPKIRIEIDADMLSGKVYVKNHVKYDKRLEDVQLSSALGRFIVSQQYCSDDGNWYTYEFEDACLKRKLTFDDVEELRACAEDAGDYTIKIDQKTTVPLASSLIVGATGSGKTYSVYHMVLSMLCWQHRPSLYFADPKNSSLVLFGNAIDKDKTTGDIDGIVTLLEQFCDQMEQRKIELQEKLNEKLDADYRDFGMSPHVFIIDEYSSFMSVINEEKKQTRDHVNRLVRSIVLQGRQLGFFLFVLMQKSDSSDISTAIRSNLIFTVVLGNATRTTLLTAFEESADIPVRKFDKGEGVYTYQGMTRQPCLISFPKLKFDLLSAARQLM